MKTGILILAIIIMVAIAGALVLKSPEGRDPVQGKVVSNDRGAQKISLSIKNYNYYPQTITAKSGMPVEITLEHSVSGCFRSFTIKGLGVSKYSKNPEDKIVFTPQKKGTYRFSCSMGMGFGTIIIE